jgi:hypothetical protein
MYAVWGEKSILDPLPQAVSVNGIAKVAVRADVVAAKRSRCHAELIGRFEVLKDATPRALVLGAAATNSNGSFRDANSIYRPSALGRQEPVTPDSRPMAAAEPVADGRDWQLSGVQSGGRGPVISQIPPLCFSRQCLVGKGAEGPRTAEQLVSLSSR